jgi:peptidoglycan/LPS O-acetylase OafA/YrhL
LVLEHGYELFPGWNGFFAAGIFLGGQGRRLLEPTLPRSVWCLFVTGIATAVLISTAGWGPDRLSGANLFLHPLFLPAGIGTFLLVCWAADALARVLPAFGRNMVALGELSFGVYLLHQYPLEVLGYLLRSLPPGISIASPLPGSLVAVLVLFALTVAVATKLVAGLRRRRWTRAALGG